MDVPTWRVAINHSRALLPYPSRNHVAGGRSKLVSLQGAFLAEEEEPAQEVETTHAPAVQPDTGTEERPGQSAVRGPPSMASAEAQEDGDAPRQGSASVLHNERYKVVERGRHGKGQQ